jgi:hypothetical protein
MREFEQVLRLDDWYDGPRNGLALYLGHPHIFRSRRLDVTEYRDDFESADIFELVPTEDLDAPPVLASAHFRRVPDSASSGWEVSWSVIELPSA